MVDNESSEPVEEESGEEEEVMVRERQASVELEVDKRGPSPFFQSHVSHLQEVYQRSEYSIDWEAVKDGREAGLPGKWVSCMTGSRDVGCEACHTVLSASDQYTTPCDHCCPRPTE